MWSMMCKGLQMKCLDVISLHYQASLLFSVPSPCKLNLTVLGNSQFSESPLNVIVFYAVTRTEQMKMLNLPSLMSLYILVGQILWFFCSLQIANHLVTSLNARLHAANVCLPCRVYCCTGSTRFHAVPSLKSCLNA